jgi:hypothetical protein
MIDLSSYSTSTQYFSEKEMDFAPTKNALSPSSSESGPNFDVATASANMQALSNSTAKGRIFCHRNVIRSEIPTPLGQILWLACSPRQKVFSVFYQLPLQRRRVPLSL